MNRKLGTLLWFLIAVPTSAFLQAWTAHNMWSWFLAAQYGPGPTLGAWFGVTVIVSLLTRGLKREPATDIGKLGELVSATIESWVFLLGLSALSLGVGAIFGWVQW